MSNQDWKNGYADAQKGLSQGPQKQGESKDAFNDRVAGADAASKQR